MAIATLRAQTSARYVGPLVVGWLADEGAGWQVSLPSGQLLKQPYAGWDETLVLLAGLMDRRYYSAEDMVPFVAERPCQLCGRRFRRGDVIAVLLGESFDALGEDHGQGGPWEGGYTSAYIRRIADQITDAQGNVVYER